MERIRKLVEENRIDGASFHTTVSVNGTVLVILSTSDHNYGGRRWQEVADLLAEDIARGQYRKAGRTS